MTTYIHESTFFHLQQRQVEELSNAELGEILAKESCTSSEFKDSSYPCWQRALLPTNRICRHCRAFKEVKRRIVQGVKG